MAQVRVTQELLEFALDLPEGVKLVGVEGMVDVEGVSCFVFTTSGHAAGVPAEGSYALQYETNDDGMPELVAALPV